MESPPWWGVAQRAIAEVGAVAGARVRPAGPPRPDSPREWAADSRAGPLLTLLLFSEYKFSARWTKVMGTAEWKASRTRRW